MAAPSPASVQAPQGLPPVARSLITAQVIDEAKAQELLTVSTTERVSFMEALSRDSKATCRQAAEELSRAFELPFADLDAVDTDQAPPESMFEKKRIEEFHAIPLMLRGAQLFIGMSDPTNLAAVDYFRNKSNKRIEVVILDETQVVNRLSAGDNDLSDEDLSVDMDSLGFTFGPDTPAQDEGVIDTSENSPAVKLVKATLLTAIRRGASDIHFEPYEKYYRIRLRVDGLLQEVTKPPVQLAGFIASRVKVMSQLNIAEKRVPQDGRMKLKLPNGRAIDFRVSTCPTVYGEKIVMRILDPSSAKLGIDALGYDPDQKTNLLNAIGRPYGMVLVTGPTGSGKTVSLYTCLNILNKEGINISTAEDPAEISLPGVNQVNVNPKQGLTFASALKAFLRQDPDVIMVGEIRDEETAEISVKAAQTGHLVLATLHTNDAPKTIARLMEIGVKPYNIAGSVILITAQRLGRKLCTHCRRRHDGLVFQQLVDLGMTADQARGYNNEWTAFRQNENGCDMCNKGYKGRVGIYQVMPITETIRSLIVAGGDAQAIAEQAKNDGIKDLRQSALAKFRAGLTSLQEVLDVTNED